MRAIASFLQNELGTFILSTFNRIVYNQEFDRIHGNETLVVYVDGYSGLYPKLGFGDYFDKKGYDSIFIDYNSGNIKTMNQYVQLIEDKLSIYKDNYKEIILLGISLGGIAAMLYLNRNKNNIKKLITISTIFRGINYVNFPLLDPIAKDLHPSTQAIKESMIRTKKNKAEIFAIEPKWDQFSPFQKRVYPDGTKVYTSDRYGHNSVLLAKNITELLNKII